MRRVPGICGTVASTSCGASSAASPSRSATDQSHGADLIEMHHEVAVASGAGVLLRVTRPEGRSIRRVLIGNQPTFCIPSAESSTHPIFQRAAITRSPRRPPMSTDVLDRSAFKWSSSRTWKASEERPDYLDLGSGAWRVEYTRGVLTPTSLGGTLAIARLERAECTNAVPSVPAR